MGVDMVLLRALWRRARRLLLPLLDLVRRQLHLRAVCPLAHAQAGERRLDARQLGALLVGLHGEHRGQLVVQLAHVYVVRLSSHI